MTAPAWVQDAVFYEVFPDRFARAARAAPARLDHDAAAFEPWDAPPAHRAYKGGDLVGAAEKLDHLEALGVTAVYLAPVFTSTTHHRYKPVDHFTVDPLLGGDAAFDAFVAGCARRGLRVILDGVFAHVGYGFPRFLDVLEYGPASPWSGWFRIERWPLERWDATQPAGYACYDGNRSMPQLRHENPAVRAYLQDVAAHWLRRGAHGWRFDAPDTIVAPGFWQDMRTHLKGVDPDCYLVGECWTDASRWLDGTQWDGAMNYPLHGAIREFAAGARLRPEHLHPQARPQRVLDAAGFAARIETLLARVPYATSLAMLNLIDSHDVARFLTVAGGDRASLVLATTLLMTLPGAPCVYYGDEVGLAGGLPPDCRRGFPVREAWDLELLELHRRLIALRRSSAALRRGNFRTLHADGGLIVFARTPEGEAPGTPGAGEVVVAVNAGDTRAAARLAVPAGRVLHGDVRLAAVEGGVEIELAPRSAALLT